MVGIVVVSHSKTLVEGLKQLVGQMVPNLDSIAFAGGIDDPDNPIGTDPMEVMEAINSVASDDGVLVLMDLGSALMSAETALEFLDPDLQQRVRLSPAPVIEGTLAAAIQASLGSDLDSVAHEARNALAMKNEQLGFSEPQPQAAQEVPLSGLELDLTIANHNGLHARPAAQLVGCAGSFKSAISISLGEKSVNAKSINQVTTLGVRHGAQITLTFAGEDAEAARAAMLKLHGENFGESLDTPAQQPQKVVAQVLVKSDKEGVLSGLPVAAGIAIGPVAQLRRDSIEVAESLTDDSDNAIQRFRSARASAVAHCRKLADDALKTSGAEHAEIFNFHVMLLEDEDTNTAVEALIRDKQYSAEYAWKLISDDVAKRYREIDDEYLQARCADVLDIQRTLLQELGLEQAPAFDFTHPVILVADDLSPSDVVNLPISKILAICLSSGGATSHAAIIASSRAIPTVVNVSGISGQVEDGQMIILDGSTGLVYPHPDQSTLHDYKDKQLRWQEEQLKFKQDSQGPAITRDDVEIEIAANIGGIDDLPMALEYDAHGIGLFRTEFLFIDRNDEPGEEEQYQIYHQIASAMEPRPVIIRTLDIGGDKPVAYLDNKEEENPFLGLRGIRYTMAHKELFLRQLRALLRASNGTNLQIMFPMIGSVSDFEGALAMLEEAREQLRQENISFNQQLKVGIMIEVPSAVVVADQLAQVVDFFSIGTNDLTQYVMAADRGNPDVAALPDPWHPAVLRMIKQTVEAAHDHNKPVGMCGAFAGKHEAAALLVGLGLDELSMNAPQIPLQKNAIRNLTTTQCRDMATKALSLKSAQQVRELFEQS